MAKKHTGTRQDEREEIASEVEEALSSPAEESAGNIGKEAAAEEAAYASVYEESEGVEVADGPSRRLGEHEPAETAGAGLKEEQAEATADRAEHGPDMAGGAESRPEGFGTFLGGLIHQAVYSGFYGLSYGATFGALLVGHLVPSDSAVAEGIRDGADAARHALEGGLRSEQSDDGAMPGTA